MMVQNLKEVSPDPSIRSYVGSISLGKLDIKIYNDGRVLAYINGYPIFNRKCDTTDIDSVLERLSIKKDTGGNIA